MQNEDQIRQRAYELWDAEGRPEGRDRQHWDQACRELGAPEQSATDPGERIGLVSDESGAQFADEAAMPSPDRPS